MTILKAWWVSKNDRVLLEHFAHYVWWEKKDEIIAKARIFKVKLKLEILPKEQMEIYPHLRAIKDLDFTLFGGTAIALQLGHRESVDFERLSQNLQMILDSAKLPFLVDWSR